MATVEAKRSVWAVRFVGTAFILGAIAWIVLAFLLLVNLLAGLEPAVLPVGPAPSRVVAGGGPGTWFVMGILAFLIVGVAGTAVTANFYKYLEEDMGFTLSGWRSYLAWGHLVLGAIGSTGSSLLMAYGGYWGGAALVATRYGGGGLDPEDVASITWVHVNVLGPLALPIAVLMGVALLGYLFGGAVLVTGWMASGKK